MRTGRSQSRVDRLGLQRQHREHRLVHPPQRFTRGHPVQRFQAERILAQRHRPLVRDVPLAQADQVRRLGVVRPVDDAQVLPAAHLDARLDQLPAGARQVRQRFDHHALAAGGGQLVPPGHAVGAGLGIGAVHGQPAGGLQQLRCRRDQAVDQFQVPAVVPVGVGGAGRLRGTAAGRQQLERRQSHLGQPVGVAGVAAVRLPEQLGIVLSRSGSAQ